MEPDAHTSQTRVATREDARRLIGEVTTLMGEFAVVLDHETAHLRAGRVREGLVGETRKAELAGSYLRAVQACRANAVALARFAPDEVERLKAAHGGFQRAVDRNQVVLATARAVSEGLVRGLADELGQAQRPQTYGAARRMVPVAAAATPLMCSRTF